MHTYQRPDAPMTVREGLAEFRRVSGLDVKMKDFREEAKVLLDRHDLVHVVFGLDTSLRQEAMVDAWTIFGATATFDELREYLRLPETKEIITDVGVWTTIKTFVIALPDFVRVYLFSRKLKAKWPWIDHDHLLDRPLVDVRKEFGVTMLGKGVKVEN